MENKLSAYDYLNKVSEEKGAAFCVLIDPDKADKKKLTNFCSGAKENGVDAIFIGSSLILDNGFQDTVIDVKEVSDVPVIIFPGGTAQVSRYADAILFLSLISGRNPKYLIEDQVLAAPSIKASNIEVISTGYMLISSEKVSTTEFISNTQPIPNYKPEIAVAHALAAQYMGMKMVYLEAGSGAPSPVPDEIVRSVKTAIDIPLIVGGGITDPKTARSKVKAGADIIVVGNKLENSWDDAKIKEFADAVHHTM